ncbi:beta-1,4-mannosyltransferase [Dendrobium catenatum]|uniref:Beta-1,4-mannosyltransferase n=1 Tax=Dendrobium catenatum TaxID=906689 RepID=A0A2I0XGD0_9ASPA|nr:beta-1,4-mannosyltransferase [Dendrobium catenatum]
MIIHAESANPTVEATISTQNSTIPMLNLAIPMPTVRGRKTRWRADAVGGDTCDFWFEKYFAKKANSSLCVPKSMQQWLAHNWGVKASVFYDKPTQFFHPAELKEKHKRHETRILSLASEMRSCNGSRLESLLPAISTTTVEHPFGSIKSKQDLVVIPPT